MAAALQISTHRLFSNPYTSRLSPQTLPRFSIQIELIPNTELRLPSYLYNNSNVANNPIQIGYFHPNNGGTWLDQPNCRPYSEETKQYLQAATNYRAIFDSMKPYREAITSCTKLSDEEKIHLLGLVDSTDELVFFNNHVYPKSKITKYLSKPDNHFYDADNVEWIKDPKPTDPQQPYISAVDASDYPRPDHTFLALQKFHYAASLLLTYSETIEYIETNATSSSTLRIPLATLNWRVAPDKESIAQVVETYLDEETSVRAQLAYALLQRDTNDISDTYIPGRLTLL